jgi:hypothetical protein
VAAKGKIIRDLLFWLGNLRKCKPLSAHTKRESPGLKADKFEVIEKYKKIQTFHIHKAIMKLIYPSDTKQIPRQIFFKVETTERNTDYYSVFLLIKQAG